MRRPPPRILSVAVCAFAAACSREPAAPAVTEPFDVVEASILDMRKAMNEGRTTSRRLVETYLTRIALYEDRFNATLHVNANALDEADERDRERADGKVRGPLHGIPIALKDNTAKTKAVVETLDVKTAILADKTIDAGAIDVDTYADTKTVVLRGSVPTEAQKMKAEMIARDNAKGYKIDNKLAVVPK